MIRNILASTCEQYTNGVFPNYIIPTCSHQHDCRGWKEPIPMTEIITLEPTFADAIKTIAAATDLPEQTRRHWCSSLAGIARAFDQPPEVIPARYSAVRARMAGLHHMPLGWVPKTLANHKSNAKAAL